MQGAFAYPRTLHARTERPPKYATHQSYRPFLEREFRLTCIYCRVTQAMNARGGNLEIEHYRPQGDPRFAHLAATYSNLFLACRACNGRKGEFWPTPAQQRAGRFVPNPCDHKMSDHLWSKQRGSVEHRSAAGKFTVDLLDLNDPNWVAAKEAICTSVELAADALRVAEIECRRLQKAAKKCHDDAKRASLDADLADAQGKAAKARSLLARYGVTAS